MTLILAGRHPELWRAAVDMFGPYEGHDVLKLPNRVRCYDTIAGFLSEQLSSG